MTIETIRVLLVDDHIVVRRGLGALLAPYGEIEDVGEAAGGQAAPNRRGALMQELSGSRSSPLDELTEREVLACIAQGMSNAKIADYLIIGERTVKTHVSNILSKLHLQDRTQAVLLALRERRPGALWAPPLA